RLGVAAGGMYALGRALGLSATAALCGAVAFELGTNTLWMAYWSPSAIAVYAWLPVALAVCERAIRRPSAREAGRLTVALGLQLLVGYPQVSLFTYQLLALRVLWEGATRWRPVVSRGRGRASARPRTRRVAAVRRRRGRGGRGRGPPGAGGGRAGARPRAGRGGGGGGGRARCLRAAGARPPRARPSGRPRAGA